MTNPQPKPAAGAPQFSLPPLPWPKNALEPHYSSKTLDFHYDKHHKAYVDKANELVVGTGLEGKSLEEAVLGAKQKGLGPLFNNVAQIYNHNLFWESMKPGGGGAPTGDLLDKINKDFGSVDKFKEQFVAAGIGQFGSGWVWLVEDKSGKLEIVKTGNAETPLTDGKKPLLVCDVWEHAYYIDYQNKRADFLKVFVDKLANWDSASAKLKAPAPKP
ncbi:MAG: superoxide dismutase [Alphaproteobacteria bacterium]